MRNPDSKAQAFPSLAEKGAVVLRGRLANGAVHLALVTWTSGTLILLDAFVSFKVVSFTFTSTPCFSHRK